MAIIYSNAIGKAKGSMGTITYNYRGGKTIGKDRVRMTTNPKTFNQMRRRVQLANIVNMWQSFLGNLHPSFEDRTPLVSDFNLFVRANLGMVPVYLTDKESAQGACVVAPYEVSFGSIPSISVSANGPSGEVGTDISLGSLTVSDSTTLKQFSDAIVENNPHFRFGDQITAFVAYQLVNTVTGVPYVDMKAFEVTLDHEATETLIADLDPELLVFRNLGATDKLGMNSTVNGGVVYIHSRMDADGKTLVSSQRLVVANTLLARYQAGSQLSNAVISYGGNLSPAYLTPNVDEAPAVA